MKLKIDAITLAVHHLEKAVAFYREILQLPEDQISKGEDHVAFFFNEDLSLVLYPRTEIARTTGQTI
ncbi:VOC family protein [Oceanobacillus polygoni]|uniref:Catechol 2,3-dioxygenase-like lactoylglutathione lyase family enzyme n=1 Tax=Oceanobacillus polygoni TaxID=1235259 RepID=A0A9X0YUY2_9BACI|nr:VOC family protein [Oceanobacillus polygoni]MBP2079099.1 catechol 2,3-dioxygenase-like lactoylglutathione lyase family enzyme [Oceanobacillus polygoni]